MSELKPCPFCGGNAKLIVWTPTAASVSCILCGAHFNTYTEAEAIEAWNTRHVDTCRLPETCIDHGSIEYNGTTSWRLCSACGAEVLADPANYCPNCGRKVEG